jgi:hypothetical protein
MRQEEYIRLMGFRQREPSKRQLLLAFIGLSFLALLAAVAVMLITIDVRSDLLSASINPYFIGKIIFCLFIAMASILILYTALQPGGRPLWFLLVVPLALLTGAAIWNLISTPIDHWVDLIFNPRARFCVLYISMLAIPTFIIMAYAVRLFQPQNARKVGALVGLVAGAIGAFAYSFHCVNDYPIFLLLSYVPSVALISWIGSKIGPVLV